MRGDAALLDAAKRGDLPRVRRLLTPSNINCRDAHGRNSTPLHLAGKFFFQFVIIYLWYKSQSNVFIIYVFCSWL